MQHFLYVYSFFAFKNSDRDKKGKERKRRRKTVSNCIPAYNNVLKYHILCFCKTFPCLLYNFMQEQQQVHMFGIGFYVGAIISLVLFFIFPSPCSMLDSLSRAIECFSYNHFRTHLQFNHNIVNSSTDAASASECHLIVQRFACFSVFRFKIVILICRDIWNVTKRQ